MKNITTRLYLITLIMNYLLLFVVGCNSGNTSELNKKLSSKDINIINSINSKYYNYKGTGINKLTWVQRFTEGSFDKLITRLEKQGKTQTAKCLYNIKYIVTFDVNTEKLNIVVMGVENLREAVKKEYQNGLKHNKMKVLLIILL